MSRATSLDVPAGGELVLEPAGSHIMLVDLAGSLDDGELVRAHAALRDGGRRDRHRRGARRGAVRRIAALGAAASLLGACSG